jgi:biopolymer transport protein TolQ
MFVLAAGNPFINAYLQSDWFGKWIFWGLFLLSGITWTVLIHKSWVFFQMRRFAAEFSDLFSEKEPLNLQFNRPIKGRLLEVPHPHFEIYKTFKQKVLAMISRNHLFAPGRETFLSEADLNLLESQVHAAVTSQAKILEKNLFVLSTVVTLAPFLGLLGTVWGILLTFSQLHAKGLSVGNAGMLSGLSLALATTVIGLVVAIPALVGHSYLKNAGKEYRRDMEDFSYLLLSSVELQYRKPDHAPQAAPVS